ncbi:Mg2+ transporter zinc transport protein [Apiospora marii]|uniref:Mg2+ transporter zinc transport protein n=1 Tax=Apiospora marii TaxID=335849 RepID=UPI00312E557E
MQRRLQNPRFSEDPYAQHLAHRIDQVCQGHMQWLRIIAEKPPQEGFLANYWVNGTPINGSGSSTWLAKDSLLDAAFQIIKTDVYSELHQESGTSVRCSIRGAAGNWMVKLKEKEHRKSFAWPHGFETLPTFRLDDHVWIWRALKVTDHPDISNHLKNNEESKKAANRFTHREVQREILRHFTTRNDDISGKRMLAVTRSCRETRFFFHARDTVLFHSLDSDIPFPLENSLFRDLWLETIDAQKRHDENHEDQWDNALRYALAVVMGCRGHSLNKRTPQELLRSSLRTLLETSSPNGLFAGQLDATTKKPICFFREPDRDFHFHCTFEIPYILLVNSSRITGVQIENDQKRKNRDSMANATTPVGGYMDLPAIERVPEFAGLQGNPLVAPGYPGAGGIPGNLFKSLRKPTVFKKRQPFYHLLDSTNIVEIEEEWLYNYPAFLKDSSLSSGADANILMMSYLIEGLDLREAVTNMLSTPWKMTLDIVQNDEELQKELCERLTVDRNLLARIALMIVRGIGFTKPSSADQRFQVVKESIRQLLKTFEKLADSNPEQIGAIYASHPTATDDPRPGLLAQPSSRSSRKWYEIRTHTDASSDPMPGTPTGECITPSDLGIPAMYNYLERREVMGRFRVIMRRHVDVFVLVGSNLAGFPEQIADIFNEDEAMLARVLLKHRSLYKGIKDEISKKIANEPQIRREIVRYMDNLASAMDKRSDFIGTPQQSEVIPESKELSAKPFAVPNEVLFNQHRGAFVVDTTKKLSQGRVQKAQSYDDNEYYGNRIGNDYLWHEIFKVPRKPKKAKKRFVWLSDATIITALVCYLGNPQVERDPMVMFFDRHFNYELYFFDDTTPHLNTWETELHISFFQVLEPGKSEPIGIPKPFRESFPSKTPSDLTKASMGFRFFGDFFDRYWTCHFVEYIPSDGPEKAWDLPFDSWSSRSTKNREWKQRKVLELYLFERIVTRVVTSTREIYERVRTELGVRGEVFSMVALDSGDYFSSSEHWQKCQETLQVVEDRLEHITTEIAKWDSRERERGSERPRWTRNDERKYSGEIKKRLGSSNSKVRDLRRLKADIKVLKELLISRQDQIRNDLGLRSDENIRFFTYVTVVFLPLGFAASIFSMSEVPDGQLIGSMAIVAAVALILTGFALTTNGISRKLPDLSKKTMEHSYLAQLTEKREGQAVTPADGNSGQNQPVAMETKRKQPRWYVWFWLTYVFIEKPARRVSMAYQDMKHQRWTVKTGASVVLALFLLPYCLFVWLVQVVAYNAMDVMKYKLKSHLPDNPDTSEDLFQGFMASLVSPSDSMRPFKLKEEPKKGRKEPQPLAPPKKLEFDQIEG